MTDRPDSVAGPARGVVGVVLALGITQIIGYGTLYYSYAILAPTIAREFAVAESTLFAIFSAGLLAGGLAAPQLGAWMDRYGAPRLMVIGSGLAAVLVAGLAAAPNLWTFALLVIATEVVSVAILYDAAFATLARLADRDARRSITHLTLIAGFASTLFWPLTGWLAEAVGWRVSYLIFAVLHLVLAMPLHGWIATRQPLADGKQGEGPQAQDFGPPLVGADLRLAFWVVAISFALGGVLTAALTVHLVWILQLLGLGAASYLVAMLMGPAQVLVRLTDALFWRALHPLSVAILAFAALPIAIVSLLAGWDAVIVGTLFAVLLGVNGGLSSIVRGTVPLVLFGAAGYGALLGKLARIRTVLGASAPFVFALAINGFGIRVALAAALVVSLLAVVPLVLLRSRLARQRSSRLPPHLA